MFCTKCGNEIPDGNLFCTKCGAKVKSIEPQIIEPPILDDPFRIKKEGSNTAAKIVIMVVAGILMFVIGVAGEIFVHINAKKFMAESKARSADKNLDDGKYDEAISEYIKALEIYPGIDEPYLGLAAAYEKKSDLANAQNAIETGLKNTDSSELSDKLEEIKKQIEDIRAKEAEEKRLKAEAEEKARREEEERIRREEEKEEEERRRREEEEAKKNDPARVRQELIAKCGTGYEVGQVVPDFTFQDQYGNNVCITDFLGKSVYINFFTTWCPYCYYEMPDLASAAKDFSSSEVSVILIDLDEGPELAFEYADEYGINFPIYFRDDWTVKGMEIDAVPLSIVIDKYGMVVGNNRGMSEYSWMHDALADAVDNGY